MSPGPGRHSSVSMEVGHQRVPKPLLRVQKAGLQGHKCRAQSIGTSESTSMLSAPFLAQSFRRREVFLGPWSRDVGRTLESRGMLFKNSGSQLSPLDTAHGAGLTDQTVGFLSTPPPQSLWWASEFENHCLRPSPSCTSGSPPPSVSGTALPRVTPSARPGFTQRS